MQTKTAIRLQETGEVSLEIKIKFDQPIPVGSLRQTGQYSIFPSGSESEWIRNYGIALNSAGVNVFLHLRRLEHQLRHKDIVACEKWWLHLVQRRLAHHGELKIYRSIRAHLLDQLNVLMFRGTERARLALAQIRDSGQPLSSVSGIEHYLTLCTEWTEKSISALPA